jgi:hypothetical protein
MGLELSGYDLATPLCISPAFACVPLYFSGSSDSMGHKASTDACMHAVVGKESADLSKGMGRPSWFALPWTMEEIIHAFLI